MNEFERVLSCIAHAQQLFGQLLNSELEKSPTTREQYIRYLSMEFHLTRDVQRYFMTVASHHDLAKRRGLRQFLVKFSNEEELHYLVAANDLYEMGEKPVSMPFDVELWHAYFQQIVIHRPFIRLGAACILENISGGVARQSVKKALTGPFLNGKNTKFLVLHQHEILPHGDQIVEALQGANLERHHIDDLVEGAKKGTVLYLRMAEWAIRPMALSNLADIQETTLSDSDQCRISKFTMKELEHNF